MAAMPIRSRTGSEWNAGDPEMVTGGSPNGQRGSLLEVSLLFEAAKARTHGDGRRFTDLARCDVAVPNDPTESGYERQPSRRAVALGVPVSWRFWIVVLAARRCLDALPDVAYGIGVRGRLETKTNKPKCCGRPAQNLRFVFELGVHSSQG